MFEVVNPAALIIFNPSVSTATVKVVGLQTPADRTGYVAGTDATTLFAATPIVGTLDSLNTDITPGIFPIYSVEMSLALDSASEILLAEKWTWPDDLEAPFKDKADVFDEQVSQSRSGVKRFTRYSKAREIESIYRYMANADRDILLNHWYPHHLGGPDGRHPFAFVMSSGGSPMLVRYVGNEFHVELDETILASWPFKFEEVL